MARPNVFGLVFKIDASDQKKFGQIQKQVNSLSKNINTDLGSSILNVKNLLLGGAVAAGFKKMMDVGQTFENAEIGFKTFLKSSEAAKKAVQGIATDAELTPFNFQSLLTANRALVSAGEDSEKARKAVLALGNAIAASGGGSVELERMASNLQQIKNTGKATATDIKQFGIAGINIYGVLADYTGKNIDEVKKMEVSYDDLVAALQKAQGEGGMFAGALENAMNSTTGKISNLGDKIDAKLGNAFVKLQPLINGALGALIVGLDYVDPILDTVISLFENGLIPALGGAYLAFVALRTIVLTSRAVWAAYTVLQTAASGSTLLMLKSWLALNAAFLMSPIGLIIAGIIALVAVGYLIYKNWDSIVKIAMELWEWIKKLAAIVWDNLVQAFEYLKSLGLFDPIILGIKSVMALWNAAKSILPSWLGGDNEPSEPPSMPGVNGGSGSGNAPTSRNQGVINSNTTTTSRSELDVNFNNLPSGTSTRRRGSAPGITVQRGVGASR